MGDEEFGTTSGAIHDVMHEKTTNRLKDVESSKLDVNLAGCSVCLLSRKSECKAPGILELPT